jgi:hypothetical protein
MEDEMFRSVTIIAVWFAALLLPITGYAANPGDAHRGGNRGGGGGVRSAPAPRINAPRFTAPRVYTPRMIAPNIDRRNTINTQRVRPHVNRPVQTVRGRNHYSHRRHYWHGRWWTYAVGSCWAYDSYYDEYYWNCGDDDDDD